MSNERKGWSWFERGEDQGSSTDSNADLPDVGRELRVAYARCFSGVAGEKVLKHLQSITLDRAFGPETSSDMLRHVEGQRQLVTYVKAQCERGRTGG
jgi:LPS sulfotransferase NodH